MNSQIIKFSEAPELELVEAELGGTSTTVHKYFVSDTIQAGVWECKKGTFTIESHVINEICHILEGAGVITYPDETICNFAAGDTLFIPKGTAMTWDIVEQIKKIYMTAP